MRRALLLTLVLLLAAPATAGAAVQWVVRGGGFGHGIGMSQYGAYGYAKNGTGYKEILAHYYTGTELSSAEGRTIRVLLQSSKPSITFAGATRVTGHKLDPDRTYEATKTGINRVELRTSGGKLVDTFDAPLDVRSSLGEMTLGGTSINGVSSGHYRGAFEIRPTTVGGGMTAVNALDIDSYIQGVVPGEMPSSWHAEALKAQAVVARSYALRSLRPDRGFDVYADVRSQAYRGVAGEAPAAVAAARATRGLAVRYGVEIAQTFFHSTSGGRTSGYVEGFGGGLPVPYLQPVDDPYDDISPVHTWTVRLTDAEMAKALRDVRLGDLQDVKVTATGETGRVSTADVVAEEGTATVSGLELRRLLDLRSHWFSIRREPDRPTR
jgi:stage II sporulation protein D